MTWTRLAGRLRGDERRRAGGLSGVDLFDEVLEAAARARVQLGEVARLYRIGPWLIRLRSAGRDFLDAIGPALRHLEVPTGPPPSLTVDLWDTASSEVMWPISDWDGVRVTSRGELSGLLDAERVQVAMDLVGVMVSALDHQRDHAVFWVRRIDDLSVLHRGSPLRTLLQWWLNRRGHQVAHAAAVGLEGQGVLLTGRGGSGKSSTSLVCFEAGLQFAGDDHVALAGNPTRRVHSLYCTGKLERDQLVHVPLLRPTAVSWPELPLDKVLVNAHRAVPDRVVSGLEVRAILLPRVTGEPHTHVRPATRGEALAALAPSTVFSLAGSGASEFKWLASYVRKLPCFWLELGADRREIPEKIAGVLAGLPDGG